MFGKALFFQVLKDNILQESWSGSLGAPFQLSPFHPIK